MNGRATKTGEKGILENTRMLNSPRIFSIQKCLTNIWVFLNGFSHVRKKFQAIVGIGDQVADLLLLLHSVHLHYLGPGNMLQSLEEMVRVWDGTFQVQVGSDLAFQERHCGQVRLHGRVRI